jgi:hypothetical protein
MSGRRIEGRRQPALVRRVEGRDFRIHRRGDGSRWVELAEGYRVRLQRAGNGWEARREETDGKIARGRTLGEVVGAVVRHYRALS